MAGHDHPRPGRARHRHPEQRALRRPAGLEPLLVHQGPAHRPSAGADEPARAVGADRGPGAADRRRGAMAGGKAAPGRAGLQGGARRRRPRPQPGPPAALSALGPAGVRDVRRRLHDHGQGPLWLCRAPQQGHLRQRPESAGGRWRGGCSTGSGTAAGARPVRGVRLLFPGRFNRRLGRRSQFARAGGQAYAGGTQDRPDSWAVEDGLYQRR